MNNEVGVFVRNQDGFPDFTPFKDFGVEACQISLGRPALWSDEHVDRIRSEADKHGARIIGAFAGWRREEPRRAGPPLTFVEDMAKAAALIKRAGIPALITEVDFLPQNLSDPTFDASAEVFRQSAEIARGHGLKFWFETTEEKPISLLRLIRAMGGDDVGVNFDPGNLTIYGTAHPLDALEIYGPLVRSVHAKDGFLPTDPLKLGEQILVGKGRVDFPAVFRKLKDLGYEGEIIIEREVKGDQQRLDIIETVRYLKELLWSL